MRRKAGIVLALSGMILLTACGNRENESAADVRGTGAAAQTPAAGTVCETEISIDTADMFTERDCSAEYDAEVVIALSDEGTTAEGTSAVRVEKNTVTICGEGTYLLSGTLSDGMVIVDAGEADKVQLVLDGVRINSGTSAAIYVRQADKVFVTLAGDSENELTNGGSFVAIDEKNIDAVIYSRADMTLNGSGSLDIHSPAGHGIVSKDDLVITGGNYDITAAGHGLSGKDSVRIADGTFSIAAEEDGIHADNDEDETKGFCYIAGGDMSVGAGDDGIHAGALLYIADGSIVITESYEGLEGKQVAIAGGEITLKADDDGVNAASGGETADTFAAQEDTWIWISGGTLSVDAGGDGIDSNGDLKIDGGTVTVAGPVNDGNGTLDYNGAAEITGGCFMGTGSAGMAMGFGTGSTQPSMLVAVDAQEAGSVITLSDADGKKLLSWTAEKEYACVNVSCPGLAEDGTYTLTAGDCEKEIVMEGATYSEGVSAAGAMGGAGPKGGGFHPRGNGNPSAEWEALPEGGGNPPAGKGI